MKKVNIALVSVVVVGAILLTLIGTGAMQSLQSGLLAAMSPFLRTGTAVQQGIGAVGKGLKTLEELEADNKRLERENQELRALNQILRDTEAENNKLRIALDYSERSTFRLVAAQVIGRDASTWWNTVKINRGFEDGVEPSMTVITDQGLVGKVMNVSKNEAIVLLVTDENCKVGAYVEGTREKGIVSGIRVQDAPAGDLEMTFLTRQANLQPGQKIYSAGVDEGVFPAGLLLGEVLSFRVRDIDGQAIAKPAVDFSTLADVFVIVGMK